jgi:hypothetical protein
MFLRRRLSLSVRPIAAGRCAAVSAQAVLPLHSQRSSPSNIAVRRCLLGQDRRSAAWVQQRSRSENRLDFVANLAIGSICLILLLAVSMNVTDLDAIDTMASVLRSARAKALDKNLSPIERRKICRLRISEPDHSESPFVDGSITETKRCHDECASGPRPFPRRNSAADCHPQPHRDLRPKER